MGFRVDGQLVFSMFIQVLLVSLQQARAAFYNTRCVTGRKHVRGCNVFQRSLMIDASNMLGRPSPSLVQANDFKANANVTVAADGSGDFTNITQAVQAAPYLSTFPFVVYIKKGVYNEYIEINKSLWNIVMIGDGMNQTIISGDHCNKTGWLTLNSATFAVKGKNFIGINITFENKAGEGGKQPVALKSDADQSIFYLCEMRGYQDTLYAKSGRQFYRECIITGTVDFIFGFGTVVFQKCDILARQRSSGSVNTITAHGRNSSSINTGFSFHLCNITGDSDLLSSQNRTKTYLGRPWESSSRVVIMESTLSDIIEPQGWLDWDPSFQSSVFYAEYNNSGLGSDVSNRVKWPGVHVNIDNVTAKSFTVSEFIQGWSFIPFPTIPYIGELQS